MKRLFIIIISIIICTNINAYNENEDRFANYSINIGYEYCTLNNSYTLGRYNNSCININCNIYGVYMDCIIGIQRPYYNSLYNWGMTFGYSFPIMPKKYKFRLFITPLIGFTALNVRDSYYPYYYNYYGYDYRYRNLETILNYGGAVGISIGHIYIQGKYTKNGFAGSIGFMF